MPRLIIPVLAMSALITVADALLSDAEAAPIADRGNVETIAPSEKFASEGGLGTTRVAE